MKVDVLRRVGNVTVTSDRIAGRCTLSIFSAYIISPVSFPYNYKTHPGNRFSVSAASKHLRETRDFSAL